MKSPLTRYISWIITLILVLFAINAFHEFYYTFPNLGQLFGFKSVGWWIAAGCLTVFFVLFFLLSLTIIWFPDKARKAAQYPTEVREKLNWVRVPLAIFSAGLPAILMIFTPFGLAYKGYLFKLILLITFCLLSAYIMSTDKNIYINFDKILLGLLLVGSIYSISAQALTITDYPFSITWSEGNRIYDYSLYFGSNRYTTFEDIPIIRGDAGRYMLWGLPFIIPNSPILLHRLWNVILNTIPYIILGYLIIRLNKISITGKLIFILWAYLFLLQAYIYTPLLLSACLVILFVHPKRFLISVIAVAVAGFYASSSRWTWLPAPAAWAVIIYISEFGIKQEEDFPQTIKRLIPTILVAIAGLVGGMLANDKLFSPKDIATSTAMSQPLLWYRLLPNATYPEGILLGLLIAILPLLAVLLWLVIQKKLNVNWRQGIAYLGACTGFLIIGLVASVKIGGGNNLHNLDMFFVTLAILTGISLRNLTDQAGNKWSRFAGFLLLLTIFIPSWYAVKSTALLQIPHKEQVVEALKVINKRVTQSAKRGEVLFLDQRQLLTFGYIKDIPLVPEYEKRYMMDKAMAGNADYFNGFYTDLANQRFSMIVTDPVFVPEKGIEHTFGDENNAWVKWVAEPLLCYYAPTRMLPEVGVQLLTPRAEPKNCPDYAIPK